MFRSVFRPYGPVWTFLNNLTDVLLLSLLWCFCCLPLVTIGAASTALYDAAVRGIRYQQGSVYRRFFRTFRQNFKTSLLVTLLWGGILLFGLFVLSLLIFASAESRQAAIMAGAYRVLMLIPLAAMCWSCVLISRFESGFRELTGNVLQFLLHHPISSVLMAAILWLTGWLCWEYPLTLLFLPAVAAICISLPVEAIFKKMNAGIEKNPE